MWRSIRSSGLRDPKAQASARATCSVGLLRAAGYLGKKADQDDLENDGLDQRLPPSCSA